MRIRAVATPAEVYCVSPINGRLRQGEIISGLIQIKTVLKSPSDVHTAAPIIDRKTHLFAIVTSQDCDLEQDFNSNSAGRTTHGFFLPNILFCPIDEADKVRAGPPNLPSDIWKRVVSNSDQRYQFLQKIDAVHDSDGQGLPALAADFKRYFTMPTDEAYFRIHAEAKRRCVLLSPYLEHFMSRFFNFQMRVALPAEHEKL